MAMKKQERGIVLEKLKETITGIIDERLMILSRLEREHDESSKRRTLIVRLKKYKSTMIKDVIDLKNKNNPSIEDIELFFNGCVTKSEQQIKDFNVFRSWDTAIVDTVLTIFNACIKLITLGSSPQFFNTTSKPADIIKRTIESMKNTLNSFVSKTNNNEIDNPSPNRNLND